MDDAKAITPDEAMRRAYYAIIQQASTNELERMVYAFRAGKLPRIPDEARRHA